MDGKKVDPLFPCMRLRSLVSNLSVYLTENHTLHTLRTIYINDNLSVGSKTFMGTKGLHTLIYYQKPPPNSYTQADGATHSKILQHINARKTNSDPEERVLSSKGENTST